MVGDPEAEWNEATEEKDSAVARNSLGIPDDEVKDLRTLIHGFYNAQGESLKVCPLYTRVGRTDKIILKSTYFSDTSVEENCC